MNAVPWVDASFSWRFTTALLHFLWQGSAVAMLVALGRFALPRASANFRYRFQVVALLLLAACVPVTYAILPSSPHDGVAEPREFPRSSPDSAAIGQRLDAGAEFTRASVESSTHGAAAEATAPVSAWWNGSTITSPTASAHGYLSLAPAITLVYFLGVALFLGRLARGVWIGHRLRRLSVPVQDRELLTMAARQARRLGLRNLPLIAKCQRISVPMVVGVLKPMILLPAALCHGLTPDQVQALLAHELAHIRRFDPAVNVLQRLLEAVLFFHPAVWYISRRIDAEREIAADEAVLTAGWPRAKYADALVRMAELALGQGRPLSVSRGLGLSAAGRNNSDFNRRVLRVLGEPELTRFRITRSGLSLLVVLAALAFAGPAVVAARRDKPVTEAPAAVIVADVGKSAAVSDATEGDKKPGPAADQTTRKRPTPKEPLSKETPAKAPAVAAKQPAERRRVAFVINPHVILHEGKIVDWDEVERILDAEAAKHGKVQPQFYSTNGGFGREKELQEKRWKLYKKLYDAKKIDGMSIGSLSPRAGERLDRIKTPADLVPDAAKKLTGRILDVRGKPLAGVEVFLLPKEHINGVYLRDGRNRNPLEEHLTHTDSAGQFVTYPDAEETLLAAAHPSGFAITTLAEFKKSGALQLQEWGRVFGDRTTKGEDAKQSVHFTSYPVPGISFHIYETEIAADGRFDQKFIPPGRVTVSRSIQKEKGSSMSFPIETPTLKPGQSHQVEVGPIPDSVKGQQEQFEKLLPK